MLYWEHIITFYYKQFDNTTIAYIYVVKEGYIMLFILKLMQKLIKMSMQENETVTAVYLILFKLL